MQTKYQCNCHVLIKRIEELEAKVKRYEEVLREIWCENPKSNGEDCGFCRVCITKQALEQREES